MRFRAGVPHVFRVFVGNIGFVLADAHNLDRHGFVAGNYREIVNIDSVTVFG